MEFGGRAMTLSLVVASSIAIRYHHIENQEEKTMIVYQETATYGLLTRSAVLVLISTLGIGGAINILIIPIYSSVAFAILFLALNS